MTQYLIRKIHHTTGEKRESVRRTTNETHTKININTSTIRTK